LCCPSDAPTKRGEAQVSNDSVASLLIPDGSKVFLTSVGLPRERVLLCEFGLNEWTFRTVAECAADGGLAVEAELPYRVIGNDGGMQICLSERNGGGEVVAFDLRQELPPRYINANIETFIGFLALYVKACEQGVGRSDELRCKDARKVSRTGCNRLTQPHSSLLRHGGRRSQSR
jgi:hypothetical protein